MSEREVKTCARCGITDATVFDYDTGSACHNEPIICIDRLRAQLATATRERDEARREREEALAWRAKVEAGMEALQRTIDTHDSLMLRDYITGTGIHDAKQRIVLEFGGEVLHDVGSIEELLEEQRRDWIKADAVIAIVRSGDSDEVKAQRLAALDAHHASEGEG